MLARVGLKRDWCSVCSRPYYHGTRRAGFAERRFAKTLLITMGRTGFEPVTLGLRGGRWDLGRSRPSWKTSEFEPVSVARSRLISVGLVAPLLPPLQTRFERDSITDYRPAAGLVPKGGKKRSTSVWRFLCSFAKGRPLHNANRVSVGFEPLPVTGI
jgi:hypothetical protein